MLYILVGYKNPLHITDWMLRLIDTWGKYFQYLVEIFRFRDKINFNILCDVAEINTAVLLTGTDLILLYFAINF